jgi:hypothetical protein
MILTGPTKRRDDRARRNDVTVRVSALLGVLACGLTTCTSGGRPVSSNGGQSGTGPGVGVGVGGGGAGAGGGSAGDGTAGAASGGGGGGGSAGDGTGGVPDGASQTGAGGSVDAASDPPPSGTGNGACAALFCEDFEQGQLDPARWETLMGGSGMAMVQQQTVAHGMYALHVHGSGAVGHFASILTKNVPMALQGAGPFYGRVYVNTAASIGGTHVQLGFAGTTRDPNVAPTISTSTNTTPSSPTKAINFNYMEFAYFAGSWQLGFDLFNPAPAVAPGFVEEASYPPARDKYPVGAWSCIEWEFGDNPTAMNLWVDGKAMAQLSPGHIDFSTAAKMTGSVLNGLSSGIIGGFSFYGFGFHNWGTSTAVDTYYDDLVLDTHRVGCLSGGGSSGG